VLGTWNTSIIRILFLVWFGNRQLAVGQEWIAGSVEVNALAQGVQRWLLQWPWINHVTFWEVGNLPLSYRHLISRFLACYCALLRKILGFRTKSLLTKRKTFSKLDRIMWTKRRPCRKKTTAERPNNETAHQRFQSVKAVLKIFINCCDPNQSIFGLP